MSKSGEFIRGCGACLISSMVAVLGASDATAQVAPRYFGGLHGSSAAQPQPAMHSGGIAYTDAVDVQQYQPQSLSNAAAYQNAMSDGAQVAYNAPMATASDARVIPGAEVPPDYGYSAGACADGGCDTGCVTGDCGGCGDGGCGCGEKEIWYVAMGGAWQQRKTVFEIGDSATFLEWQDGFALTGAIGRRFDVFRLEGEISFMNNRIDFSGAGVPGVGDFTGTAAGNVSLRSYMLNVYHDIKFKNWAWEPYVGAGIGFYQSSINSLYPIYFPEIGAATGGVNSTSDLPFAYQFRVGASRPLTERTDFYIGYRYFNGADLSFAGEPFGPFAPDSGITNHLECGLRVNF